MNFIPRNFSNLLEFSGAIGTCLSLYFITEELFVIGYSFGILSSLIWIVFALVKKLPWLLILNIIIGIINIKGFIQY